MKHKIIRGITLIECLVSVVILAIGLTAIAFCLNSALVTGVRANRIAVATARAQTILQTVRSLSTAGYIAYAQATTGMTVTTSGTTTTVTQATTDPTDLPGGTETVTLVPYSDATISSRVEQVTVTLSWPGEHHNTEKTVLIDCIANRSK